jgi:peroxiredoxin
MRAIMTALMAVVLGVSCANASPKLRPGSRAPEFTLKDGAGKSYALADEMKGKIVVIIFMGTHCPASNGYNQRMQELYRDYASKGVSVFGINANDREKAEEVLEHAKDHNLQFPVLKDVNHAIADAYGAQVTPESFVIDKQGVLRYHGRIDDDMRGKNITSHDLRNALDALLAGKAVPVQETRVFGCGIERVSREE